MRPSVGRSALVALAAAASVSTVGCAALREAAPACVDARRVALVAQSVPGAAYVPCIDGVRPGWHTESFRAVSGHTRFSLVSDRDAHHPVDVDLRSGCSVGDATPTTPRGEGVRTYLRLRSVSPRFTGELYDVFPGGCVASRFDFARGPHIGLIDDFESQLRLLPRQELRLTLRRELGLELDR